MDIMSRKRARSQSPPGTSNISITSDDFRSQPIEDRSSVFVGAYSPTASAKTLQAHPDFKTASHRIAAWRKPSKQRAILPGAQPIYSSGHDDDGESYAGKKVEKVLEAMNVEGAVVVARWYGGILLGPVRFTHMENCAKQAIAKYRAEQQAGEEHASQKRKIEDDARVTENLVHTLEERDRSVTVLRDLLAEKKRAAPKTSDDAPVDGSSQTPTKKIDYTVMALPVLRRLEKARDTTIAWILKEIDKVEEEQKVSSVTTENHSPAV